MRVTLTASGEEDALVLLWRWLSEDEEFRGRVRSGSGRVEPGAMGPITDALLVQVGPAIATFTTVLVAWLQRRGGRVEIEVSKNGGPTVRIRAEDVRRLDAKRLQALSADLAERLAEGTQRSPADEAPSAEGQAKQA
jgi:hypothetical protein